MGERTHSKSEQVNASSKQKITLLLAGTAVALLAAGALFQVFRAEPADAGAERATTSTAKQEAGVAKSRGQQRGLKHLARVNNHLISYDQVADECMSRFGKDVLDKIIHRTIIQQACEDQGIIVTAAEVDAEILNIAKRFDLTPDNWLQMLQIERDISPVEYQRDVIWPMLALKKLVGENIEVTQEDMQKSFIRDYGERVKIRMIMLDNQRRANDIWNKLQKSPEDFQRLAREHSVEPNSRALSGAIPPIHRYSGNEELEKAAFSLKEGEISGLIQVGLKRFVILLSEGRTVSIVEFDDVKESLHERVLESKVQESVAKVYTQLKNEAEIHNFLNNTSTGGVQTTAGTTSGRTRHAGGLASDTKRRVPDLGGSQR